MNSPESLKEIKEARELKGGKRELAALLGTTGAPEFLEKLCKARQRLGTHIERGEYLPGCLQCGHNAQTDAAEAIKLPGISVSQPPPLSLTQLSFQKG